MIRDANLAESEGANQQAGFFDGSGDNEFDLYGDVPAGTHLVEALFRGEYVELNPKNVRKISDFTVERTAEFIVGQEEGVTLIIPLDGGFPLADELLRKLEMVGYDLSKIDLRFVKKTGEERDGKPLYIIDDEDTPFKSTRVVIDDIVDKTGCLAGISGILRDKTGNGKVVCFTPVIKAEGNGEESTEEKARKNGFSIAPLSLVQVGYADINYATVLPNEWIDCAFGMNSNHADKLSKLVEIAKSKPTKEKDIEAKAEAASRINAAIEGYRNTRSFFYDDLYEVVAKIQTLERFAPVCLAGEPKNFGEYGVYLEGLSEIYPTRNEEAFGVLLKMECAYFMRTNLRKEEEEIFMMRTVRRIMSIAKKYFEGLKGINYEH